MAASGRPSTARTPGKPLVHQGLVVVFAVAAGLSAIAALASLLRGGRYVPGRSRRGNPLPPRRSPGPDAAAYR